MCDETGIGLLVFFFDSLLDTVIQILFTYFPIAVEWNDTNNLDDATKSTVNEMKMERMVPSKSSNLELVNENFWRRF